MRVWAVVVLVLFIANPAQAECILRTLEHVMPDSSIAWVFSGRIREATRVAAGQIATIDVDRVWKGAVPARVVVYQRGNAELVDLQFQERYLVFAYIQSRAQRARFSVTDLEKTTYETDGCAIQVFSSDGAKLILGNATGGPPSQIP